MQVVRRRLNFSAGHNRVAVAIQETVARHCLPGRPDWRYGAALAGRSRAVPPPWPSAVSNMRGNHQCAGRRLSESPPFRPGHRCGGLPAPGPLVNRLPEIRIRARFPVESRTRVRLLFINPCVDIHLNRALTFGPKSGWWDITPPSPAPTNFRA